MVSYIKLPDKLPDPKVISAKRGFSRFYLVVDFESLYERED